MGWDMEGRFKREGTYVYLWLIHADVWQKLTQYCNYLSIKNKFLKKLKVYLPGGKEVIIVVEGKQRSLYMSTN